MNSLANTKYTSLCLKVVGIVFIVSSLFDFITLSLPIKLSQINWQLQFVNNVVDRGIVPMIGIVLFLVGWWIQTTIQQDGKKKKGFELRLPLFILAVIMGICYLVVIPIHITNVNQARRSALVTINRQAEQQEARIMAEYNQIQQLLSDPQSSTRVEEALAQIDGIVASGRELSQEQAARLQQQRGRLENYQKFIEDPDLLNQERETLQNRLDLAKTERVTQANLESLKQGLRISFNSFLLAIGYSILGWFGLKNVITSKTKSRASVQ